MHKQASPISPSYLEDLALRAEYEIGYSEESTQLFLNLHQAIVTGDLQFLEKTSRTAKQIPALAHILEEDLMMLKLYIASSLSSYVATSIRLGLPNDQGELIKREGFHAISKCLDKKDLLSINSDLVKKLIEARNKMDLYRFTPIIQRAYAYVYRNKFHPITVSDVAKALKVNRSYLSSRFHEETGITLLHQIQRVKINIAIELMDTHLYHHHEIAEMLGYKDYPTFSKIFKRHLGYSPSAYSRQEMK